MNTTVKSWYPTYEGKSLCGPIDKHHYLILSAERNKEEEEILEQVRKELGLKHIIRVCASTEQAKVVEAARRLLKYQHQMKAAGIKLEGELSAGLMSHLFMAISPAVCLNASMDNVDVRSKCSS